MNRMPTKPFIGQIGCNEACNCINMKRPKKVAGLEAMHQVPRGWQKKTTSELLIGGKQPNNASKRRWTEKISVDS